MRSEPQFPLWQGSHEVLTTCPASYWQLPSLLFPAWYPSPSPKGASACVSPVQSPSVCALVAPPSLRFPIHYVVCFSLPPNAPDRGQAFPSESWCIPSLPSSCIPGPVALSLSAHSTPSCPAPGLPSPRMASAVAGAPSSDTQGSLELT